jgi:outer membrane protein insertion porin family
VPGLVAMILSARMPPRRIALVAVAVVAASGLSVGDARADVPPRPATATPTDLDTDLGDPDFGPEVEIEKIVVTGNDVTNEKLVLRSLLLAPGDRLRSGDPRFRASRFRVLALGFFRDVQLELAKGSRRGAIVLTVRVVERETLVLNRIDLGTSDETQLWLGLDVGATNLFGSGIAVSAAAVYATAPQLPGGQAQLGLRFRIADQGLGGTPLGIHGTFVYDDASEAQGDLALGYRRIGASGGLSYDLSARTYLSADVRVEEVHAKGTPPVGIQPGDSRLVTAALGLDYDTRSDPILPSDGARLVAVVQAGGDVIGSNYDELKLHLRWEGWQEVARRHVLSLHLDFGLVAGGAPLYDRFYVGDLNPLLPDRKLDLVVSTRPTFDLFGRGADAVRYGDVEVQAAIEYDFQLFRGKKTIYGGDLFFGVGVFALGSRDDLRPDLWLNVGLRLDTAVGVIELSVANLAGRLPL